jgi:hypothetical protein
VTLRCQPSTPTGTHKSGSLRTHLQDNDVRGYASKDFTAPVACSSKATAGEVDNLMMIIGASTTEGVDEMMMSGCRSTTLHATEGTTGDSATTAFHVTSTAI